MVTVFRGYKYWKGIGYDATDRCSEIISEVLESPANLFKIALMV